MHSLIAIGLLAMLSAPCSAQDTMDAGFYLAPIVQAVRPDADRALDNDAAFTLATGFAVNTHWNLELNLFRGRFDSKSGGDDLTMNAVGFNALRMFQRGAVLSPYLLVGIGALEKDHALSSSATNAYADAGAGLLATFRRAADSGRSLSLRLDGRVRYDDADGGNRTDYILGLGLQYAFGSRPKPAQAATAALAPRSADTDTNGIADAATVRRDETASGQAIGADGGNHNNDAAEVRLPIVHFDFDSAHLSTVATASLDQAAEILRKHPDAHIEVAGHTDNRGHSAYNIALSERRARAVRDYLTGKGVTNTLTIRGHGITQPLADNATKDGRARNRRVVLLIVSQ